MKQKIKQTLMAIVGLLLSTSTFAHSFEVDGIYYNILTDSTVAVTFKGSSYSYYNEYIGAIMIPSSVTNYNTTYSVTSIGSSAFGNCSGLTSVTIPNSVTSIGYNAFKNCSGLTSVTIPNSVTSIGDDSFYGCSGLTEVTIPNSVTSIGDDSFYGCSGLTEVNFNAENCTSMGSYNYPAFENCPNLKTINIGNSVKTIPKYAFKDCSGLSSVTIPNSVTSIGGSAFNGCSGLTSVTIGNSVTSIGDDSFYGCSGLTEVNFNAENCTSMGSYNYPVFENCPNLKTINIGNSVKTIPNNAFKNCSGLTSVTIPNSVTSIGNYAFSGCSNLYSLTIGSSISTIPSSAFSVKPKKTIWFTNTPPIGYSYASGIVNYVANDQYSSLSNVVVYPYLSSIFEVDGVKYVPVSPSERTCDAIDCSYNLTDTIINIGNTVSYKGVAMAVKEIKSYTCNGNNYIKYCILNFNGNIEDNAFNGCSAIKTITFGEGLETIGNSAFYGCSNLTEVIIPNSVTSLGESAFYGCSSLASATIGIAIENINSSTFYNCKSLENIKIGTGVKTIGEDSFRGCSALPIIEIPKNVTSIGDYAFYSCNNLSTVIIEDRDSALTLGSNWSRPMFSDCSLDSVYIGGDISYKTTSGDGYSPFYNNKTLRAVTITDKETEISDNEFYGCANLKYVSIGDGVEFIGDYAFSGCSSLESFAFGSSMKTIGEEAFSDCTSLVTLRSRAMTPPVCGTQALDDINKWSCELFVPGTSIQSYQTADQWKEFFFISEDTGVEDIIIDGINIEIEINNGEININGADNPHVEIYNLNGQCIYSGNEIIISGIAHGIYIVKINGISYKVII